MVLSMPMNFAFLCKEKTSSKGRKVAIIGAGPAGLVAAGYLSCQGYDVDAYEKLPRPGGMLVFAIPPWRIPRERVLNGISLLEEKYGVKFIVKTKVYYGEPRHDEGDEFVEKTVSIEELLSNYDALLITTGTWRSRIPRVPGSDAGNVVGALEYVYKHRLKEMGYIDKVPYMGRRVIVIGGGYSAVDASEQAVYDNADEVYLVYRRTIAQAPAGVYEIERIKRLGVEVIELASPTEVVKKNGRAVAVKFQRMKLGEPDETGRPRPIPIPGSEFTLDVDLVVFATGEAPTPPLPEDREVMEKLGITVERGRIIVDDMYKTGNPKIFAAGDVVTGPSRIGQAIRTALHAARSLHNYLKALSSKLAPAP